MINVISKMMDSKEFINMSADARLLFYDLYYRAGESRKISYDMLDGVIEMTRSSREAFNELYEARFIVLDWRTNAYTFNKYWGMWNVISEAGAAEKKKAFPPDVEEVAEYCKGNTCMAAATRYEYAERFVAYYTANGWQLSNGRPMKDWKAVLKQWLMRDNHYVSEESTEYVISEFKKKSEEIQEKFGGM